MSKCCQIERNDPCPCGTGRKYKKCNVEKCASPSMRKFKATVIKGTNTSSIFQQVQTASHASTGLSVDDLAKKIRGI